MKEIILNSKKHGINILLIDDEDYELIKEYNWYADKKGNTFYVKNGKFGLRIHRLILNVSDPSVFIDHIDGNGLNNQKSNLRICTPQENALNIKVNTNKTMNSTSKYKGVYFNEKRGKWIAQIQVGNKKIYLGGFDFELDAALIYNNAAIKYHGNFAHLNKIPSEYVCKTKSKVCTSKYKGVYYDSACGVFRVKITTNKVVINLGKYDNEDEAGRAYNIAALKYFGEFARLNVIEESDK